ncbi:Uncharacterized protein Rs2_48704 [Raphanus sativus]|nr:Uncharacterized protein Rs2_48704 [Raphanus sativus]
MSVGKLEATDHYKMEKAKKLLVQDPKLKKSFKFDHVWVLMKDIPKFTDNVNFGIPNTPESPVVGSPTSQSPGLSSFSINLSSDDGGSNSSQHPIGSKKAKLKRKISEGNNSSVDTLVSSNEQVLDFLKESASSREKNNEIVQLRMQNQAKKLAFKEMREENKMLLTNLESISDHTTREFIRCEQERIIKKRTQEQQQPSNAPTFYGQLFSDIGGSGSNLPDY